MQMKPFTPKNPIARRRAAPAARAGGDVSLEELYQARQTAAECVMIDEKYLPIFERVEREIEAREEKMKTLARAQAAAQRPAYIEGESCPIKS